MKKYVAMVVLLAGFASVHAAPATNGATSAAQKEACLRAHVQFMDKPAVKNAQACWHAHAFAMDRQ